MAYPTRALLRFAASLALICTATQATAQKRDVKAVAHNLVQAGLVKAGDNVLISGAVRDSTLMEEIAIETMKAGGNPVITVWSERLARRSFTDVPTSFDTMPPKLDVALIEAFDVRIPIDIFENEGVLAGIPETRRAARAKASEPANQAYYKRHARFVNLGNGLYPPSAALARRLGIPRSTVTTVFWKAAAVPAATLRAKGDAVGAAFTNSKEVTLTHPNGTNITFGIDAAHGFTSDGTLTPEKVAQGSVTAATWIPAGEYLAPATAGTANGTVVFDKVLWDGRVIRGLRLTFANGRLTAMTAASPMEGLRAAYDAAGGAKDQFGYIDIGVNPETKLPVGTGRTVWTAPGSIVVGFGDNRGWGGSNASDWGFAAQLGGATLKVDGKPVIESGQLK